MEKCILSMNILLLKAGYLNLLCYRDTEIGPKAFFPFTYIHKNCFLISAVVTCPSLSSPSNGQVQLQSLQYQSNASYSCNEGHFLVGEAVRICLASGLWSGEEPICER